MSQDERATLAIPNSSYPLTEMGCKQATIVGKFLNSFRGKFQGERFYPHWIHYCFTSTFVRTQSTNRLILDELEAKSQSDFNPAELDVFQDSRLDEKWDGIFHELSRSEIELRYNEQPRIRKRSGYYHYRAPGGENCPDVELRIRSFVEEYLSEPFHGSAGYVMVVGHGRWFQIFQKLMHELSVPEFLEYKSRATNDPCAVTVYKAGAYPRGLDDIPKSITPWKGKLEVAQSDFA